MVIVYSKWHYHYIWANLLELLWQSLFYNILLWLKCSNQWSLQQLLQLKTVSVCGPRYWPQVIELNPEGIVISNLVCRLLINYLQVANQSKLVIFQRNLGGILGIRMILLIRAYSILSEKLVHVLMSTIP